MQSISKYFELPAYYTKKFFYSIYWNLLDSAGSQALMLIHHVLLRTFIGASFHGIFGSSLSLFYFLTYIFNLGLDNSITSYVTDLIKSKKNMRMFIISQFIPQVIFIIFCSTILYIFRDNISNLYEKFFHAKISNYVLTCIAITFIIESIRKTLRKILQLIFKSNITAIVEVGGVYLYIMIIWTGYFLGTKFDLNYCWSILAISFTIQMIALLYIFYKNYRHLPDTSITLAQLKDQNLVQSTPQSPEFSQKKIFKVRSFTWLNQCVDQLFNSNFIIPACALYLVPEHVSILKIFSSIFNWFFIFVQRAFGISSNALLANTKDISFPVRQKTFKNLTYILSNLLTVFSIFIYFNAQKIIVFCSTNSSTCNIYILYLIFAISSIELFFALYQAWFMVEQKINYFFIFNVLSLALVLISIHLFYNSNYNLLTFILFVVPITRISNFILINIVAYYKWKWNIWPNILVNTKVAIGALATSIIFYLLI